MTLTRRDLGFAAVFFVLAGAIFATAFALARATDRGTNEPCVEMRGMTCCVVQAPGLRCLACDTGGVACAVVASAPAAAPAPNPSPRLLP